MFKPTMRARALRAAVKPMAIAIAVALALPLAAQAQAAPPSAAKKELVAKVLKLQQAGVEALARSLVERPAAQLMQQAGAALQRLPADKREATARDIEADVRKYAEESTPTIQARAVKLAPSTIGALLEERFTEEELREVLVLLESPVNKKFQSMAPDMQRAITEKLVADSRGDIEPKLRALEQSVAKRLGVPANAAGGEGGTPKAAPKK